jgi:hypothetical protein
MGFATISRRARHGAPAPFFLAFRGRGAKKRRNPFTASPEWSYFSMGDPMSACALDDLTRGSPRET